MVHSRLVEDPTNPPPIIDMNQGMQMFGNNEKLFCELLVGLNLEPEMSIIAKAIPKADFYAYYNAIIYIRSHVGWVSAMRLTAVANEIESAF